MFEKYIQKSISYQSYREKIDQLFEENKVTGDTQSEALLNYTKINIPRMNRVDKTYVPSEKWHQALAMLSKKIFWLIITEGWCGDSAQLLPALQHMAKLSGGKINLGIVFRDENPELMNNYLTNGTKSIPIVVAINKETSEELFHWGPRPKLAQKLVKDVKEMYPEDKNRYAEELHKWYANDRCVHLEEEMIQLINSVQ